jgi:RNase H-fold protein (predicted Holliday junction resolvase)
MKKLVLATLLASLVGVASAAGPYASITYDEKDKQNSTQMNYVYGLNVGQKFDNGFTVEVRMEDERVETGTAQKQESLAQVKVSYDIATGTAFTPYVAGAVGHKNKATIDFNIWVAEAGVKAKFGDFGVRYGYRRRADWDNSSTNAYNTDEQTVALGYNLTKNDNISIAVKQERRNDSVSSEYNTKGIYYTRSF